MKILLAIATYKRIAKLQRCLDSIAKSSYKNTSVVIIADNQDEETARYIASMGYNIIVEVQTERKFVIGAWNRAVKDYFVPCKFDGFLGLCDDVELHIDALAKAVAAHKTEFPDTDGVVGFKQECPGHPEYTFQWFGQTLMGKKFVERYASVDYRICCPAYKHFFQDEEMFTYAQSLGKFYKCEEAVLKHYHPGFVTEEKDATHDIIRVGQNSPKSHDQAMFYARRSHDYLWGRDFKTIGNHQ